MVLFSYINLDVSAVAELFQRPIGTKQGFAEATAPAIPFLL